MKKFSFGIASIVFAMMLFFQGALPADAVSYGGFGGRPAFPDPNDNRTESWFIVELEPGESRQDSVIVSNNSEETKTLRVYPTDTTASSGGGFACTQYLDPDYDVGTWIEMEKDQVTLAPGESEQVNFTFNMPVFADVGEHTGCIAIDEANPQSSDGAGAHISKRVGVRIYINVPGELHRELVFKTFEKQDREDGGVNYFVQMENLGNTSVESYLTIESKRLILGSTYFVHEGRYPILRETVQDWNYVLLRPFFGAIIRANLTAGYAEADVDNPGASVMGEVIHKESKLLLLMPHPIAMVLYLIVIAFIIFILFTLYVNAKRKIWIMRDWVKYKVRSGDTVKKLGKQRGVNWKIIVQANKLKAPYELKTGTVIKVPPKVNKKK